MAYQKLTDLAELSVNTAANYVHVVDVANTTDDSAGSSRKVKLGNLQPYAPITRPTNGGFDATTFAKYFPFSVWRDASNRIQTNFDWRKWAPNSAFYGATAKTYYVSTTGNDANTGLSWAQAYASINKAIAVGNTAAVPYLVNVASGFYQFFTNFGDASGTTIPNQTCAFVAVGGRVISSQSVPDSLTSWVLDTGTTYKVSSLIGTPSKMQRVVALDVIDQWGDYTELTKAASVAACRSTPGSWAVDGTTLYVNRTDGAAVTTNNVRAFYNSQVASTCTSSGNMYIEGFDFEGGESDVFICKNNANGRMVFNNCSFKWSSSASPTTDENAGVRDVDGVAFINCVSARGQNDGFGAHQAAGKNAFVIWIGCMGHHHGSATSTSSNAITTHDGIKSISINGTYWSCQGGNSAHVNAGTQHWSIGDACHSSVGDIAQGGSAPPSDWFANQGAASIWVDSARSVPGTTSPTGYYSLYTDSIGGAGANIYYRGSGLACTISSGCSVY